MAVETLIGLLTRIVREDCFEDLPILADAMEEAGRPSDDVRTMKLCFEDVLEHAYDQRRRRRARPEGKFDNGGRWIPSPREDIDGTIQRTIRSPSRHFPFSYMFACRSRKHVKRLVEAAFRGEDVPRDISEAMYCDRRRCYEHVYWLIRDMPGLADPKLNEAFSAAFPSF